MKKLFAFALALCVTISAAISTLAATGTIVEGRTMVPVRGVFEQLGFNVLWDHQNQTAYVTAPDGMRYISITKGNTEIFVYDVSESIEASIYEPDVAQRIINGSFYIPLRAVADCFSADISWDANTKIAHISYKGKDVYVNCSAASTSKSNSYYNVTSKVPGYEVYASGSYGPFLISMYSSGPESDGCVGNIRYKNSDATLGLLYRTSTNNVYSVKGGTLGGRRIGVSYDALHVEGSDSLSGRYSLIEHYYS